MDMIVLHNYRMKLLSFPYHGDPILNRIQNLKKYIQADETGEYLDDLLLIVEEFCKEFPAEEFPEIAKLETKVGEARFWLNEHFETPDLEDVCQESLNDLEN